MNRTTIHYTLRAPENGVLSGLDPVVISGINLIGRICLSITGKRQLTLIGYAISLSMMGYGFFGQATPIVNSFAKFTYILAPHSGHGTLASIFNSEMLPNKQFAEVQSSGVGVNWGAATVITLCGSGVVSHLEARKVFYFFIQNDIPTGDQALHYVGDQQQIS